LRVCLCVCVCVPVFSTPPCKHVNGKSCPSWIPRWLQERMAQSKGCRYKWKQGYQAFLLLLVNSWAQVRSHCFSAKGTCYTFICLHSLSLNKVCSRLQQVL
jgi:hypothetical protein